MKARFTIFFILIILLSCADTDPVKKTKNKKEPANETSLKKPGATFQDTVFISEAAAVFFSPDSAQLSKLKAITDTMIFSSMEHDCYYQMRNAKNVINDFYKNISIIESSNARYFKFTSLNGNIKIIDLDQNNDPCGIYLFDGKKDPRLTDMTNIDSELSAYYKD